MKIVYLALIVLLSSCSLLNSGETKYTLKPIKSDNGDLVCCEAAVFNSKDYQKLVFKFVKNADGSISVTLDEKGVSASDPATIQAENNAKLLGTLINVVTKVN